jgi:hypothetical protein
MALQNRQFLVGIGSRPDICACGYSREVVERMYHAWWKSMVLQATLWCQPYFRDGDF